MPRRAYKKPIMRPDPIYGSMEVAKLINYVMFDGKKTVAMNQVYKCFDLIKAAGQDPLTILHRAIEAVAPSQEVRPRRIGGASYLVPTDTRPVRKLYLAMNWIVDAAKARSNREFHTFAEKLNAELQAVLAGEGEAIKKRASVEKLADSNKAFAHFKW